MYYTPRFFYTTDNFKYTYLVDKEYVYLLLAAKYRVGLEQMYAALAVF